MVMALQISASSPAFPIDSPAPTPRFVYPRAMPSIRWPQHSDYTSRRTGRGTAEESEESPSHSHSQQENAAGEREPMYVVLDPQKPKKMWRQYRGEYLQPPLMAVLEPVKPRKMSKLALKRAKDWRQRVQRLSDAICRLDEHEFVRETVDGWKEQLAPTDLCYVVKRVANTSWQRALELYECLNVARWYAPNPRMLAVMLSVLGRANQPGLAQELFDRAESSIGNCVQVYNSLMSVYARHGDWNSVQQLLCRMQDRGCRPDLVTFNIVIKARTRGGMQEGLASSLLQDVYAAGLRPDTITYNTLISACSLNNRLSDAILIFEEMQRQGCDPDIWTYNAMISVYGRAGRVEAASSIFRIMQEQGFTPDAVTYNSVLHAFARDGRIEEVERIRGMMRDARCSSDEITYNTMIHMYGKAGMHRKAEELYVQMKEEGRCPDSVTFTVLIDTLGKAGFVNEAAAMFEDMLKSQVRPTLQAFSAMICAYAKADMFSDAEHTYSCMLRAGVRPDLLAYSVMLDVFFKAEMPEKCIILYKAMVGSGLKPELSVYAIMVRVFYQKSSLAEIENLSKEMVQSSASLAALSSTLAKGGFYAEAAVVLKISFAQGVAVKVETLNDVLGAFEASGKLSDARDLVHAVSSIEPSVAAHLYKRLALMLAKAGRFSEAEEEMRTSQTYGQAQVSDFLKVLVASYDRAGMQDEALARFLDMTTEGLEMDAEVLQTAVMCYCRKGFAFVAHELLIDCLHAFEVKDSAMHVAIIASYGKLKLWQNAEIVFRDLQRHGFAGNTSAYSALLSAYAETGNFERATRALDNMVAAGLQPNAACANYVLEAFGRAGKAKELSEFYQRLPEMGITPNSRTFVVIFHAFSRNGNLEEARSMYRQMREAGFSPSIQVFKALLALYSRETVEIDAEELVKDIKKAGLELDMDIYNHMISLYSKLGSYRKAALVFKGMQEIGCSPDATTFNTLIMLYSRNQMVQEAQALLREMIKTGNAPNISTYTTLISAYGRLQAYEDAELVFKSIAETGCKPDATAYNVMINVYRKAGEHRKIEEVIEQMKADGFEPSLTTIHMLMDSYGKGGATGKAEEVLETLPEIGMSPDAIHYTSIINSHLNNKDYLSAVIWLRKMTDACVRPTHVTITCFVGAASVCERSSHALMLLKALSEAGFSLPLRLMTECTPKVVQDMQDIFDQLQESGPEACQGVVNVLMDLLWAFRQCATAALVFAVAIESNIYTQVLARVKDRNWGADFRRLSPGAALVALILWLDQMQDASLQGSPVPPKSIQIDIGSSKLNNQASVSNTIKTHLWQMGSPFLPSKTRAGVLVAKSHALCMWLKESPYCLDLELKNTKTLPDTNAIQVYNGAFVWAGLAPAIQEIDETMGDILPKKFARLVHLTPEGRTAAMEADLRGRAEKLAKQLRVKLPKASSQVEKKKEEKRLRKAGKMRQSPKLARPREKQRFDDSKSLNNIRV
ncbi:pentatricopeptide repeat-containing protein At3g18110, chloroplastic [Selaginella moellendorffii]|nr:pentatricopeptide repeat-containing protein At3g18110, chloroplastic [Selaginella moellendorffii]|eukprot:XP_002967971.2 pentatricopeptide repeat-containing protein At3g18110, chloroplastic [Selaginella moellendorffii]